MVVLNYTNSSTCHIHTAEAPGHPDGHPALESPAIGLPPSESYDGYLFLCGCMCFCSLSVSPPQRDASWQNVTEEGFEGEEDDGPEQYLDLDLLAEEEVRLY